MRRSPNSSANNNEARGSTMRKLWLHARSNARARRKPDPEPRTGLSEPDDPHRRALCAGRRRQHPRPDHRHQDAGDRQAAGGDRQPSRRGRQCRRRRGRESCARRLHDPAAHQCDGKRARTLQQASVRPGEGFRAGLDGDLDPVRDRRLAEESGHRPARACSPRQGQARHLQFRIERTWLVAAHLRRDVQQHSPASRWCTSPIAATRRW